jgi:protein-S-isoprenylcysteine O-methyltransferase Ste14
MSLPPLKSFWGKPLANWPIIARRIRVPLGFLVAALYLWLAHPSVKSLLFGVPFVIAGLLLRGWASGHLQKNERLATTGPYAYTRNPLYLGSLLLAAGFAIAARSWWVVLLLALMFLMIYLPVIRSEEEYLAQRFPEFRAYASEVPRLMPRMKSANQSASQFSWALYGKHREYHATLGSVAIMAILVGKRIWFSR